MTAKPVIPRAQATADVESAIDHHLAEDASDAALGFVDALEQAYGHISRNAATGSPSYAHELGLPGLRSWPLTTYPFLVFYLERDDHIDVWRVLHTRRDIPQRMAEPENPGEAACCAVAQTFESQIGVQPLCGGRKRLSNS